jgi:hypothetical protein
VVIVVELPVLLAARSKAKAFGQSPSEFAGSNPNKGMNVVVSVVCCQVAVSATS